MKIAIFHELPLGGARRVANELGSELKLNNTVDLYFVDQKNNKEEEKFYSKIYFFKFAPKHWTGGNWKLRLYKDTIELVKLYLFHRKVASIINKKNYDLVVVHPSKITQAPFVLRFLRGNRIYYAEEVYRIMYEPAFKFRKSEYPMRYLYETTTKFIKKSIDRLNAKRANVILVSSKHTRAGFKKFYNRNATLCYPGVDAGFFKPKPIKKDIDVLFIGSLDYETDEYTFFKNSLNFVKTDLVVKVLGEGQGWLSDEEVRNYYQRSKLVVCTSRNEPLGLVPLEAAACGVPTIAIASGGYKETVIDGATGYLVKRDPIIFASVIERLVANNKLLEEFGKNARRNVLDNWTWNEKIDNFNYLFEKYASSDK